MIYNYDLHGINETLKKFEEAVKEGQRFVENSARANGKRFIFQMVNDKVDTPPSISSVSIMDDGLTEADKELEFQIEMDLTVENPKVKEEEEVLTPPTPKEDKPKTTSRRRSKKSN